MALETFFPFQQDVSMFFFIGMTHFTGHIGLHMFVVGEGNAVNFPLVFFEPFVTKIAFRAYDVDLMRQVDRALGVALDT
jgi:hypothetical protein